MSTAVVKSSFGKLEGEVAGDVLVFRGIPYSVPPVGARRFALPEPPQRWQGTRDATRFGPAAVQVRPEQTGGAFAGMFGPGELGVSEDCLYLNVWVPGTGSKRRPVMVWVHGGAFRMGTGASPMYDGARLARAGDVVVVTINYRVASLGFAYRPSDIPANLGIRDQIAALSWVQSEIENFGGDPDNVTVFGESAGGKSVECLLSSPMARGLFQRAIVQSTYQGDMTQETAMRVTNRWIELAGGDVQTPSAADLLEAQVKFQQEVAAQGVAAGFFPVVDGEVLVKPNLQALAEGVGSTVPVIIGTNRDENRLFGFMLPEVQSMTRSELADRLARQNPDVDRDNVGLLIEAYRAAREGRGESATPAEIWSAISTDRLFRRHSLRVAESLASLADVRCYQFNYASPMMGGRLGACHGLEIPFVFGNMEGPLGQLAGEGAGPASVSRTMQAHWLAFARGEDLPDWELFDAKHRKTMTFDIDSRLVSAPQEEERRACEAAFPGS